MENMWDEYSDYELACLSAEYGMAESCVFSEMIPVRLANRAEVESLLTQFEFETAFGE